MTPLGVPAVRSSVSHCGDLEGRVKVERRTGGCGSMQRKTMPGYRSSANRHRTGERRYGLLTVSIQSSSGSRRGWTCATASATEPPGVRVIGAPSWGATRSFMGCRGSTAPAPFPPVMSYVLCYFCGCDVVEASSDYDVDVWRGWRDAGRWTPPSRQPGASRERGDDHLQYTGGISCLSPFFSEAPIEQSQACPIFLFSSSSMLLPGATAAAARLSRNRAAAAAQAAVRMASTSSSFKVGKRTTRTTHTAS